MSTTITPPRHHQDPASGVAVGSFLPFQKRSMAFQNPCDKNAPTMKIKLDLSIPVQKSKKEKEAEEAAAKEKAKQLKEESEARKRKKEEAQNGDETERSNFDMSSSINEINNNNDSSASMTERLLRGDEEQKEKEDLEKLKREQQQQQNPQWSMDTLGFFLITKEGDEGNSQPYNIKGHRLESRFVKRLEQKIMRSESNTASSIPPSPNNRSHEKLVSPSSASSPLSITTNEFSSATKEQDKGVETNEFELSEYKCKVLGEAVEEKINWWKSRARELDASQLALKGVAAGHSGSGHNNNNNHDDDDDSPLNNTNNNMDDLENSGQRNGNSVNNNNNNNTASTIRQHELTNWRKILLHEIRVRVRRQGITPAERVVAWPLLAGLEFDRASRLERIMEVLETRPIDSDMRDVMLRDLGRTLPTHSLFRGAGSIGQTRLERVLVCYCALDPEVGYCQGMGFIVAVLLLHMPEADAFGLFVQMMHSSRYQLRGMFQSGFPLMNRMLELLRQILRQILPNLMQHFDDLGIDPAFFASHWFLTLFSYQFSVPVVCRIWDLFLSEGWIWIYRVAIALLISDEHVLLEMTMEDILIHVKLIHEGKSEEQILRMAKDVPIRESDLINIESEYVNNNSNEDPTNSDTVKNTIPKKFP